MTRIAATPRATLLSDSWPLPRVSRPAAWESSEPHQLSDREGEAELFFEGPAQ